MNSSPCKSSTTSVLSSRDYLSSFRDYFPELFHPSGEKREDGILLYHKERRFPTLLFHGRISFLVREWSVALTVKILELWRSEVLPLFTQIQQIFNMSESIKDYARVYLFCGSIKVSTKDDSWHSFLKQVGVE